MNPFVIYALPRSRTYWISKFLSFGPWVCEHDLSVRLRGLDDIRSALDTPYSGAVDTAGATWWRLIHKLRPDARTVVIRQPVDRTMWSLINECGTAWDEPALRRQMERLDAKLDQIEKRVPGVLSLTTEQLNTEEGCKALFEHCLQTPFDPAWWRVLAPIHMVINFPAQVRYCRANAAQIERLKEAVTQRIRLDMTTSRRVTVSEMTYQEEPFEEFLRDGRRLISEHHVAVGKPADEVGRMNLGLMRDLAKADFLHVMTARRNGTIHGYLMSVTAPSLEAADKLETHTNAYFADPHAPGVGAALQRAVLRASKSRGSDIVYSRAGIVGSGPRLGALFQRLGATHFGGLHAFDLT